MQATITFSDDESGNVAIEFNSDPPILPNATEEDLSEAQFQAIMLFNNLSSATQAESCCEAGSCGCSQEKSLILPN